MQVHQAMRSTRASRTWSAWLVVEGAMFALTAMTVLRGLAGPRAALLVGASAVAVTITALAVRGLATRHRLRRTAPTDP